MMVGRDVVLCVENDRRPCGEASCYSVEKIRVSNEQGRGLLADVSFRIHRGEILGVAGVEGNGQSELMRVLSGLMTVDSGRVRCGDEDITDLWPDELRKRGIGIIPEDRYEQGLCRGMDLAANCAGGYHFFPDLCRFGVLDRKAMRRKRDRMMADYDIRVADADGDVGQLSGGNAQKIIIARELDRDPRVILAAQPTRGVDVGSIEYIHTKLLELKAAGKAILLVSSDLSEIMSLSDRVIVLYRGEIMGEDLRDHDREGSGCSWRGAGPGGEGSGEAVCHA
jgi:simple sugar transport system ATP-binding protein